MEMTQPTRGGATVWALFMFAAVVLLACLWWGLGGGASGARATERPDPTNSDAGAGTEVAGAGSRAEAARRVRHETEGPETERVAADTEVGGLRVVVTWAGGEVAADIPVFVRAYPQGPGSERRAISGVDGVAKFAAVSPGRVRVSAHRGTEIQPSVVQIRAGEEARAALELPLGMVVTGVVVDLSNAPIAGSDIVVAGWAGQSSRVLTQSNEAGEFELPGVGASCSVGARAAGFAPSMLHGITGKDGERLAIRIPLAIGGGALLCAVLQLDGTPAAAATVVVGLEGEQNHPVRMADGSHGVQIPSRRRTDDDGTVRFASVPTGEVPVAVRLRGHAPWTGSVRIAAGSPRSMEVRLDRAAELVGHVRDTDGEPLAEAWVEAGRSGWLEAASTRTGADGSYRLSSVALGELRVEVQAAGRRKVERIRVRAGQTTHWDPVLPSGRELRGRLLGPDGRPVEARIEGRSGRGWVHGEVGADGRFSLPNVLADQRLTLKAHLSGCFFPVQVFVGRPPHSGELELQLAAKKMPSAHLIGRLRGPDGEPVLNAQLSPLLRGNGNSTMYPPKADGTFQLGPFPPGEYRLLVGAKGFASVRTPWHALAENETIDLGTLRLEPPGTLAVRLNGAAVPPKITAWIYDRNGGYVDRCKVEGGIGRLAGLASGDFQLHVRDPSAAAVIRDFTIRSGNETQLDVRVATGQPVRFLVTKADETTPWRKRIEFEVTDAAGRRVIHRTSVGLRKDGVLGGDYALAPGRYAVAVRSEGRQQTKTIEVRGGAQSVDVQVAMPAR